MVSEGGQRLKKSIETLHFNPQFTLNLHFDKWGYNAPIAPVDSMAL